MSGRFWGVRSPATQKTKAHLWIVNPLRIGGQCVSGCGMVDSPLFIAGAKPDHQRCKRCLAIEAKAK